MKLLLTAFCMLFIQLSFSQLNYSRVKIYTDAEGLKQLSELGVTIDHGTHKKGVFFISDFSEVEIQTMKDHGFQIEILIEDVKKFYRERNEKSQTDKKSIEKNTNCNDGTNNSTFTPEVPVNFNLGSMAGFFTYQEMLDELDAMATQYPNLISVRAPISNFLTFENRPLYWLRISDNPTANETDEKEVLYTAIHHAREPNALSEVIFYMWYLLENYNNSEEIKYLVDNTEMYFVPCVNPDGYNYNYTTDPNGGGMHRKNRRDIGSSNKGVDLNRNYSYGWGTTGISFDVNSDVYPGTGAFSEPETQAIKWLCDNHDFEYAFNAHTYGNDILFPIGVTTSEFAADHDYFDAFTHEMVKFNSYGNFKSSGLYEASGDSDDYMYADDLLNKPQIFAMTPEIGGDGQGFWPASTNIIAICQDMFVPNLLLSHLSHRYLVVKDEDPSMVENSTGDFHHSAYRLGIENGSVSVSIQPLQGILSVGSTLSYDLNLMETQNGAISYVLNPALQFGDPIKYILKTDYGQWVHRDTIEKTFGSLTLQALEDASSFASWTGNWSTTNAVYYSPSSSFTESPSGNYTGNSSKTIHYNQEIDLTNAAAAMISFQAKWDIESDFDYCQFQVSTDNGGSWLGQCGLYTVLGAGLDEGGVQPIDEPVYEGTQASWVREEIKLDSYLGQKIKVRFQFEADGGLQKDGFYFDDFQIFYNSENTDDIQENELIETKLIPNPANGETFLSLSQPIHQGKMIVFDQTGKILLQQVIEVATNKLTINTQSLPSGIYTVQLFDVNVATKPMKLVVVH